MPRTTARLLALAVVLLSCELQEASFDGWWLVTMDYSTEDCADKTQGVVSPMGVCVDEGLGVFALKTCEHSGSSVIITTETYTNSKCSGTATSTVPQVVADTCISGLTYSCVRDTPELDWPAVASYVSIDDSCGEWASIVQIFNPNCTETNPYATKCEINTMVYQEMEKNCSHAGPPEAVYAIDKCRTAASSYYSTYYATCNGVDTIPGVTSANKESSKKLTWWAVLLVALGCLSVIGCLIFSGTRQLRNFVDRMAPGRQPSGAQYKFLDDMEVDKLRGSETSSADLARTVHHYAPPPMNNRAFSGESADVERAALANVSKMLQGNIQDET